MNAKTAIDLGSSVRLPVRLAVIDLDGTLIHTAPDLAGAANRMLQELGRDQVDLATVESWIGNGVQRLVKRALTGTMEGEPETELYKRAYSQFLIHYQEGVCRKSRPYPGVLEGLVGLRSAGIEMACITNKAQAFTEPLLKALELDGFFQLVLAGDTLAKKKPDPLPLLHACEHFGIQTDQAVLVGDSVNDTQAARAADMHCICVSYGYNQGRDMNREQPFAIIDSLAKLPSLLELDKS